MTSTQFPLFFYHGSRNNNIIHAKIAVDVMCECHLPIKIDVSANGTKVSDRMVSSAKEFLRQHAAQFDNQNDMSPIFLYLAFQETNSTAQSEI